MQAKVKTIVKFDPVKTYKEFEASFNRARRMVKSEIVKDSAKFTPMRDGTLKRSVIPSSTRDDQYLIWNTPYAKFLYKGLVMVDPLTGSPYARKGARKILKVPHKNLKFYKGANSRAGSEWFNKAKEMNLNKWLKIYSKGAKR